MALTTHDREGAGASELQKSSAGKVLWIIIAVSLGIHAGCLVLGHTVLSQWRWEHHPVHASVEMAGGLIAVLVAMLLLSLDRQALGTSFNTWIAGGLVGMGMLDGMHALVHVGQPFVWLHSLATFSGGLLFSMVWLPSKWAQRVSHWWSWAIFAFALAVTALSLIAPDLTPAMLVPGTDGTPLFSNWAVALNVGGGALLLVAAVQLILTYLKTHNTDDLLFCLHCLLFGAAAIMFQQSQLWDVTWWGWHLLRLMAYSVALWFVVLTIRREQEMRIAVSVSLQHANETLESRVAERTQELTSLANNLRRTNGALERSNQELEQFAYVASHDLKEPLRKISSYGQLLREECGSQINDEGKQFLDIIGKSADRLRRLITDLLAFSRINTQDATLVATDAGACLKAAIEGLELAVRENDARITHDTMPWVMADESHLTSLLQNLIGNGLKYRGEESPEIHVGVREVGNQYEFSIQDNGIGIEPQYFEKVFEIFKRLHGKSQYSGTGIGLALCKRIINRFGGDIWLKSAPSLGSTFYFTLDGADTSTIETPSTTLISSESILA